MDEAWDSARAEPRLLDLAVEGVAAQVLMDFAIGLNGHGIG